MSKGSPWEHTSERCMGFWLERHCGGGFQPWWGLLFEPEVGCLNLRLAPWSPYETVMLHLRPSMPPSTQPPRRTQKSPAGTVLPVNTIVNAITSDSTALVSCREIGALRQYRVDDTIISHYLGFWLLRKQRIDSRLIFPALL